MGVVSGMRGRDVSPGGRMKDQTIAALAARLGTGPEALRELRVLDGGQLERLAATVDARLAREEQALAAALAGGA
jgi:CO/xanthine dehydrogenase Mo-binding subunit